MATPHGGVILRAEGVRKVYPGTVALDDVEFDAYQGKVNVLVGQNGAGKSTLMKILAGAERPTKGHLVLRGKAVEFESPREALDHGISIIHQELDLFPNLSVAENIHVGVERCTLVGTIQWGEELREASRLLQRVGLAVDPATLVGNLPVSQQQLVAIARALAQEPDILIMDEPTSALTSSEVEILFRVIRQLTTQGVTVIYISHRLDECLQIGDRFTVLRDGRVVGSEWRDGVDLDWLVQKMTGRKIQPQATCRVSRAGEPLLVVEALSVRRWDGQLILRDVSFAVHAGEVVGLYGLVGAGRTELLEALVGLRSGVRGRVYVDGRPVHAMDLSGRMAMGIRLVPEDRQAAGLVNTLSVVHNVTLASLDRFWNGLTLSRRSEAEHTRHMVGALGIKAGRLDQSVAFLSGGNQQKVVIARNLLTEPRVLLLDEPTRGIDVSAKVEILGLVRELAERGLGVVFVSSELEEVMLACDRVLVLNRGRITAEFQKEDFSAPAIMEAAVTASGQRERVA